MNKRNMLKALVGVLLLALLAILGVFTDSTSAAPTNNPGKNHEIAPYVVHEFGLTVFLSRDDKSYPACVSAGPAFVHGGTGGISGLVAGAWDVADSLGKMPDKPTAPPALPTGPIDGGGKTVPGEPPVPAGGGDNPGPVVG